MPTFIALLRGINVGGHRKVPMAGLRALCGDLGFTDAATYIQSGNLVFKATGNAGAAEKKLEAAIETQLGFAVDILVRTAHQWSGYVAENPLMADSDRAPNRVMLLLSKSPPKVDAVSSLRARAAPGERIEPAGEAIWIHYASGQATTKLSPSLLDRLVGSPVTARNWRTVLELASMAKGAAG